MVRNEGFEPPIADSESAALPLGELREKSDIILYLIDEKSNFIDIYFFYL